MTAASAAATPDVVSFAPEAPALSCELIRKELELLHQRQHRTYRTAIFASLAEPAGDGALLDVTLRGEAVRFRVIDTSGELDLRRKLAREDGEASVYIVPFARQLPRDLEAVFASGRLCWPQVEWLLPGRFGAKSGTPRLLGSKLRSVVQREGTRAYARGEAPSIDLDDAWLVFLRDRLGIEGLETEAQLFAATLLDREHRGKALAALLAQVKEAREELAAVLARRMGPSAPRVLSAWLNDAGVELAAMAVVGEAARAALSERQGEAFNLLTTVIEIRVLQSPGHALRHVRDEGMAALARALVDLGYLVPLVWQKLDGPGNDALRRAILGEAEALLAGEHVRPHALGSNRLPFVFAHRCKAFVGALEAAASAPDGANAGRAIDAVTRAAVDLLAHDAARGDAALEEQVEMAARLAAFLGEPVARGAAAQPEEAWPPQAEVIGLAAFQAEVGAYVDWARQTVRTDGSGPLGKGLQRLVVAVDRVRDVLDARFARAYARLVGKKGDRGVLRGAVRLPDGRSAEVVLIEDALARMGLDLLERSKDLRLLVLCMDGMSGANLAELWASFDGSAPSAGAGWGSASSAPSVVRTSFVPVSRGRRVPVLAHVPTITKLSRSALFAGRALVPGESLDTGRDGDRLAQHPAIQRIGEVPIVLLKGDVLGQGGGLSDDASRIVKGDRRVVAVVVNAIDDQLKGSAQLHVPLSAERIRPLRALLEAAESTGRLVLLVSDHGNVRSLRLIGAAVRSAGKEIEGAERGARYRALGPSDTAAPDEIELPAGPLAMPKGADRVAVAVHETLRYTSMTHAGEHGGASLAEVVAPAVLLAPRGLLPELEALDVHEAPLDPPAFWHPERARAARDAAAATPAAAPLPALTVTAPAPRTGPAQVALPFEAPRTAAPPELAEGLFKTRLFRQQIIGIPETEQPRVKDAIALLVRNGGRMTWDAFAVALKIDAAGTSVRVPGFMSRVERVLNLDQEPVIEMDRKSQTITLDERLLRAIFMEDEGG
ncbi:BREX-2 system phosphatase PglZ [Sorangium sp. So ce394]|uniref:BREX-2 system phosphatase PglZ n=1 Tax=Sorangium sp. So ce394 TaxID=3133310 RepID=UPI003F5C5395